MEKKKEVYSGLFLSLAVVYVACLMLSNLIAGKMWALGSFTLPAAVVLFPLTYILSDVFTEVYGFEKMRKVIWLGFFCCFLATVVYMITIFMPHPDYWQNQEAFATVLGTTPRVFIASLIGYLFGEFSNSMIMSKLKVKTGGKHLWVRTIGSTLVGEAFDAVIFITISFWGTMDNSVVLTMIVCQYLFKVIYEIVFTPLTYFVIGKLKKTENVDVYDYNTSYRVL